MNSRMATDVLAEKQANDLHITAVCIVSVLVSAITAAVCWYVGYWRLAEGIAVGAAVSTAPLIIIRKMVNALNAPSHAENSKREVRRLQFAAAVRYVFVGFIIWIAMRYGEASGIGIAIGVSVPFAILLIGTLVVSLIKESHCKTSRRL